MWYDALTFATKFVVTYATGFAFGAGIHWLLCGGQRDRREEEAAKRKLAELEKLFEALDEKPPESRQDGQG